MTDFIKNLATLKNTYNQIYLIVAPPRSSSTAFARVLWNHPTVDLYCHEPFDRVYHRKNNLKSVIEAISTAARQVSSNHKTTKDSLVIKEMTFQVGEHFSSFISITQHPVIFLIRDPRLSILSRMQRRKEGGQTAIFPLTESGWHDLQSQILFCKENSIPYCIIDSKNFRNQPEKIFKSVLSRLKLPFSQEIFSWKPMSPSVLGTISDEQSHWYEHIQKSITIEPEKEMIPEIGVLEDHQFQEHIEEAFEIYQQLNEDSEIINCIDLV
jgi:hypothetical protein